MRVSGPCHDHELQRESNLALRMVQRVWLWLARMTGQEQGPLHRMEAPWIGLADWRSLEQWMAGQQTEPSLGKGDEVL